MSLREDLEIILIGAILEFSDSNITFTPKCFKSAMSILLRENSLFEQVPKKVYTSSENLKKTENDELITGLEKDISTNFGEENYNNIEYFKQKGILIYDGIHGSAFGRMSYIYRSKGIRIYLLENSRIMTVCPYSYIDHNGFDFVQEEIESQKSKNYKTEEDIQNLLVYTKEDINIQGNININEQLIKVLTSIKKPFHRDYYLEYLLTPPDVDKLSAFSEKIKIEFWNVCLSKSFKKEWGKTMQENAISFLSFMQIPPSPIQLLSYLKRNSKKGKLDKILAKLNSLEGSFKNQKEDIFEFKPNISGIGINLNEIQKRLKDKFNL